MFRGSASQTTGRLPLTSTKFHLRRARALGSERANQSEAGKPHAPPLKTLTPWGSGAAYSAFAAGLPGPWLSLEAKEPERAVQQVSKTDPNRLERVGAKEYERQREDGVEKDSAALVEPGSPKGHG